MTPPLVPVGLELSLACPSCRAPVALNAVVPRIACDRCKRVAQIPAELWAAMLGDPLREAAEEMQDGEQRELPFDGPLGLVRRVVRRAAPACQACEREVSPPALFAAADSGWLRCGGCARPMMVRRLGAVTPGAELLLGEAHELVYEQPMVAEEARAIPCPSCSAPLRASPDSRELSCPYCRATSYVPDDVWARLHPTRPVTRFFAFVRGRGGARSSELDLGEVCDAVVDGGGNLYVALDDDGVAALNADLSPRWIRRDVERNRVALIGGRVVAFNDDGERCRKARALDPRDGSDSTPFKIPPETALLQGDFEGNALALIGDLSADDRRVVRLDPAGRQISLFDRTGGGLLARLGGATHEHLTIGAGGGGPFGALPARGLAVFRVKMADDFYVVLAVHDQSGREVSSTRVPIDFVDIYGGKRIVVDAFGRMLFADDGKVLSVGPHGAGTFLSLRDDVSALAPLPNGELWVFTSDGARRFDRDGREVYSDVSARAADRQRELDGDDEDDEDEDD